MDNVVLWCGEPLAEMPRERLIEIIFDLAAENTRLNHANSERSVAHIRDLASMGRRLHRAESGWLYRLLSPSPQPL